MLSLQLLGTPQISLNEIPLNEIPSGKNLALLAYLALENGPHPREKLAALLWSDQPQARAQSNLRMALYTLNQILPNVLIADRASVRLNPAMPLKVDLLTLQTTAKQPTASLNELQTTAQLWRGELLQGLSLSRAPLFEEWHTLRLERARLDLFGLLERLSNLAQQSGQAESAISALRQWLSLEPWSENTHRRLILALARAGLYTEALAQYETCRAILQRELGLEPMPETHQLAEQIKQARALPRRHNLPTLAPIIGREAELRQIHQHLLNPATRLLSLVGLGGIGKSRLALAAGQQLQHTFLHGIIRLAIETDTQVESLPSALLTALQHPLPPGATPQSALSDFLRERELLIILDGFEHILAAAPSLKTWLDQSPRLKILVTTRQSLQLRDEIILPLSGLPESQAAQMFSACAQRLSPRFNPQNDPAPLLEICQLTGGIPLALELAAAWTPHYPLTEIARQIRADSESLSGAFQDLPPDQRSLRAIIEFSWNLLTRENQTLLAALSVFRANFTHEQARQVSIASNAQLSLLAQNNFLQTISEQTLAMHEIVRQFAANQLARTPQNETSARRAHQTLFGNLLREQNALLTGGETTPHALQTLAEHHQDLRTAWETACQTADSAWLEAAAEPLHKFSEGQARYREGESLFALALASLPPASTPNRLRIHHAALLLRLGRLPEALAQAEAAQDETHPPTLQGFAANLLGILYTASAQPQKALSAYQHSIKAYQQTENTKELLKPLANLGPLLIRQNELERALQVLQEGLALARQHNDLRGQTHFLNNLGVVYFQKRDYPAAAQHYQNCANLCEQIGNDGVRLVSLYNLAEISLLTGNPAQALQTATQSAQLAETFADKRNQASALRILGQAQLALNQREQAKNTLQTALNLARQTASPAILLDAAYGWACFLLETDPTSNALEILAILRAHPASDPHLRQQADQLLAQHPNAPHFTPQEAEQKSKTL